MRTAFVELAAADFLMVVIFLVEVVVRLVEVVDLFELLSWEDTEAL